MKVMLWEDTSITTYSQVVDAYQWCNKNLGPTNKRWSYGKDSLFLGRSIMSCPEEIEWIDFKFEEDALAFRLVF